MRDNNDIAPVQEHPQRDVQQGHFQEGSFLLSAESAERPVYRAALPPSGYQKDPEDKNHLLIDEETAPIVRRLFAWALEGHGPNYIRRRLEEEKIPCPDLLEPGTGAAERVNQVGKERPGKRAVYVGLLRN